MVDDRVRVNGCAAVFDWCDHAGVTDEEILTRPIGWWLKQADAGIEAAFNACLGTQGFDRRDWQVLTTLARSSTPRADVVAALAAFDEPDVLDAVVDELKRRDLVDESNAVLSLTAAGAREHAALVPLVERVRRQVATALPEHDYLMLVRLLARLVAGLPQPSR